MHAHRIRSARVKVCSSYLLCRLFKTAASSLSVSVLFQFQFPKISLSVSLNLSLRRLTQVPNLGVSPRSWIETILLLSCQRVSDVAELENKSKALFTLALQIWFTMSVSRVHLEAFAQLL